MRGLGLVLIMRHYHVIGTKVGGSTFNSSGHRHSTAELRVLGVISRLVISRLRFMQLLGDLVCWCDR